MAKPNQTLNTSQASHVEDRDVRSPRTPTYVPSPMSFPVPAFDPSSVFTPLSPTNSVERTPSPPKPLVWVWECHLCRSRYPLGATRRCLLDGHFYCAGETDRPNLKKKKKGQSCSSEFDYIGWKEMEQWKRKMRKSDWLMIARESEGCENCEFPSQCRYANHDLLGKDRHSAIRTEGHLDTSFTALSESRTDSLSRFYKTENIIFESILAGYGAEADKANKANVTDYYKPDKKSQSSARKSSNPVVLQEVMKSADRRSGGEAALSPIQEESKADHGCARPKTQHGLPAVSS